ncbi:hypothetical protein BH10ACT1_BH10ACT1_34590 [soil metagenome]
MEQRVERRIVGGLAFDPVARRLSLGGESRLMARGAGNRAVLEAYVHLVALSRGVRPSLRPEVRQEDLDALATALDLDDVALEPLLVAVLGGSTPDARRLMVRLRTRRLALVGAAAVVVTAVAVGGLLAGGSGSSSPDRPMAPVRVLSAEGPTTADVETDPAVTVDANGVGLIDPIEVDAEGVTLIPAVSVDQDPDAPSTTTPG